jgi:hypothetical protein
MQVRTRLNRFRTQSRGVREKSTKQRWRARDDFCEKQTEFQP